MTQPTPSATQTRHPWRATLRTAVAGVIGVASLVATSAAVGHVPTGPGVAEVVGVATGITRVLAMPAVEALLHQYAPWLAAQPSASS